MGENIKRYSSTVLASDESYEKKSRSPFLKSSNILSMENGDHDVIELDMTPKKITDDKPIIMATAILQNSKLHFLEFVYTILWQYFQPGSLTLNYCDTDSLCISKNFEKLFEIYQNK